MNHFTKKLVLLAVIGLFAFIFWSGFQSRDTQDVNSVSDLAESASLALTPEQLKSQLETKLKVEVESIEKSPIAGFYQAFINGEIVYISDTAQYLMAGNLLELTEQRPVNLSLIAMQKQEEKLAPKRAELLASVSEDEMVVFKAKQEQYVITVFTDVDCGYCRRLHQEVPKLNEKGVTVRYMAYPRAGLGSPAHKKLESIWCAKDRLAAMDAAKLRGQFAPGDCQDQLASQFQLSQSLRLNGTPAIILTNGAIIGGYMPANELIAELKRRS